MRMHLFVSFLAGLCRWDKSTVINAANISLSTVIASNVNLKLVENTCPQKISSTIALCASRVVLKATADGPNEVQSLVDFQGETCDLATTWDVNDDCTLQISVAVLGGLRVTSEEVMEDKIEFKYTDEEQCVATFAPANTGVDLRASLCPDNTHEPGDKALTAEAAFAADLTLTALTRETINGVGIARGGAVTLELKVDERPVYMDTIVALEDDFERPETLGTIWGFAERWSRDSKQAVVHTEFVVQQCVCLDLFCEQRVATLDFGVYLIDRGFLQVSPLLPLSPEGIPLACGYAAYLNWTNVYAGGDCEIVEDLDYWVKGITTCGDIGELKLYDKRDDTLVARALTLDEVMPLSLGGFDVSPNTSLSTVVNSLLFGATPSYLENFTYAGVPLLEWKTSEVFRHLLYVGQLQSLYWVDSDDTEYCKDSPSLQNMLREIPSIESRLLTFLIISAFPLIATYFGFQLGELLNTLRELHDDKKATDYQRQRMIAFLQLFLSGYFFIVEVILFLSLRKPFQDYTRYETVAVQVKGSLVDGQASLDILANDLYLSLYRQLVCVFTVSTSTESWVEWVLPTIYTAFAFGTLFMIGAFTLALLCPRKHRESSKYKIIW